MNEAQPFQPILPRISMRWYFVMVAIIGALIAWIMASEYQQTLTANILLLCLAVGSFLGLSAVLFLIAYAIGSVEKIFFRPEEQIQSPFAHETMPPQIIPPVSNE